MRPFSFDIDGPVFAMDHGGHGDPIVLVHGLGGSHSNWEAIAPSLAAHGRVFALDLAGFGRTPPAGRRSTVDANQQLLHGFIDLLASGPVTLVGNSMGGLITLLQASRHPETVERLVLLDPAAPAWAPTRLHRPWAVTMVTNLIPGLAGMLVQAYERSRDPEQRVKEGFHLIAHDPSGIPRHVWQRHVAMAAERKTHPWAIPAYLEAYRSIVPALVPRRYDRHLAAVEAPTLLIHGREDGIVPIMGAERIARRRPDWTFVPLDGVGHVPMLEAPIRTTEILLRWLHDHSTDVAARA